MKYNKAEKPFKNLTGMVIVIVLAAVILFVSFAVSLSKFADPSQSNDEQESSDSSANGSISDLETGLDDASDEVGNNITHEYYDKLPLEQQAFENTTVTDGPLAIIDSSSGAYPALTDEHLIPIHSSRIGNYGLKDYNLKIRKEAMTDIDRFIMSFYAVYSGNGLGIAEGYNSGAVGADEDLRSGYSVKFTTYGTSNTLSSDNFSYLSEQAYKYGIIQRYPVGKTENTDYDVNLSIYRYVGLAHSSYMNHYNLCLEEYIDKLRTEKVIEFKNEFEADAVYVIYYVEKNSASDITYVSVPSGDTYEYTVSGDGSDGFIVTVKIS